MIKSFSKANKFTQMNNSTMPYFFHFNKSTQSPYFSYFVLLIFCVFFFCFIFNGYYGHIFAQTGFTTLRTSSGETDSLYREMLSSVEGAISISADVRQQIHIFGQDYTATGEYNELKPTELRGTGAASFRLDMRVESPTDATEPRHYNSLTIVCDNTNNYIYRYFSIEGEKRLERIEIKRMVEAIEKQGRHDIPTEVGSMFGLGGLAGMLREMRNRYDFMTEPATTQINEKSSNGKSQAITVWKIHGTLKPEIVRKMTAEVSGNQQTIPKHTPTAIDIYIGMGDRFPYRFDYYWSADGTDSNAAPYAYLLFYNIVLHEPHNISKSIFDYRPPGNIPPNDITDRIVNQLLH